MHKWQVLVMDALSFVVLYKEQERKKMLSDKNCLENITLTSVLCAIKQLPLLDDVWCMSFFHIYCEFKFYSLILCVFACVCVCLSVKQYSILFYIIYNI